MSRTDPRRSLPSGMVVDTIEIDADGLAIVAHQAGDSGRCPTCGGCSDRVHSMRRRRLLDRPSHGHASSCASVSAASAARPTPARAGRSGRRTARLDLLVGDLGIALGGRGGSALARRPMLPAGKDTVVRTVRSRPSPKTEAARVMGIDEWAWRRRQRCSTVIRHLEAPTGARPPV